MRPRFSLRWLLIVTALIAATCYWWIARPTIVAERFVRAFKDDDLAAIDSVWNDQASGGTPFSQFREFGALQIELAPRSAADLWRGERRLTLNGRKIGPISESHTWTLVASNTGVRGDIDSGVWSFGGSFTR
jgi:hypothetical protein